MRRVQVWALAVGAVLMLPACSSGGTGVAARPPSSSVSASSGGPSAGAVVSPGRRWRALVVGRRAHLFSWDLDSRGDLLGVWTRGFAQFPRQAFAVRTTSGQVAYARAPTDSSVAAALRRGWIVSTTGRGGTRLSLIDADARLRRLAISPAGARPRPGDVLVRDGGRLLSYRPATGRLSAIPAPPLFHPSTGYLTPEGRLVVVGGSPRSARWARFDGRGWTSGRWRLGHVVEALAGAGDTVVAVLGRSMPDGIDATAVAGVAVSYDGGITWQLRAAPPRVVETLDTVVLRSGTAFVATGSGQLLRIPRHGRLVVVPRIRPVSVSTDGHRLFALTSNDRRFTRLRLHVSSDGGRTWSRVALPGRGG